MAFFLVLEIGPTLVGTFFFHFGLGSKPQETPVPWFKLHYQGWSKMSDLFTYNKWLQFQVKVVKWPNILRIDLQNFLLISGAGSHMTNCTFQTSYQISTYSRCKWSHSKLEAAINTGWVFKWLMTVGCGGIKQNLYISKMAPKKGELV